MEKKTQESSYGELEVVNIRLVKEPSLVSEEKVTSHEIAARLMRDMLKEFDREAFCVMNLSTAGQPINMNVVSVGTLDASMVSPREVFKSAILSNAAAFICFHNHPSGSVKPSYEDVVTTKRLKDASELMGIKMLDHIIVGGGNGKTYSFAEHDYMDAKDPIKLFDERRNKEMWER